MMYGTARLHLATTRSVDNMLRFIETRAGIIPQLTNNSIRATTIPVLSAANRHRKLKPTLKAITRHPSEASIRQSCWDTPTFEQFENFQTSLGSSSIRPGTKTRLFRSVSCCSSSRFFKPTAISNSKYFWWGKSVCFRVHSRRLAESCTL